MRKYLHDFRLVGTFAEKAQRLGRLWVGDTTKAYYEI